MIERQSQEIQEINNDFESTLLEIEAHNQTLIEEKCNPIDQQIQATNQKIERIKERIQKIQSKSFENEDDLDTDFESRRIATLEDSIQNLNKIKVTYFSKGYRV